MHAFGMRYFLVYIFRNFLFLISFAMQKILKKENCEIYILKFFILPPTTFLPTLVLCTKVGKNVVRAKIKTKGGRVANHFAYKRYIKICPIGTNSHKNACKSEKDGVCFHPVSNLGLAYSARPGYKIPRW